MARAAQQLRPVKDTQPAPIEASTRGLKQAILDDITALRNNSITPARANAMSRLVTSAIEAIRIELEVYKVTSTFIKPDGSSDEEKTKQLAVDLL